MRKIYSFTDFSSIFEADIAPPVEGGKLYSDALGQILTYALSAHGSGSEFPIASYAKEKKEPDYNLVKSSPILNKPEALKKIMANVQKAAEDNTAEGAKEAVDAYVAVGVKAADALIALINQYKDQPEELETINTSINLEIDDWIKILNESLDYSGDLCYSALNEVEVLFQGKKGKISDVLSRLADLTLKLKNLAESPGMASAVSTFQAEANDLQASMGALQNKKNREINKADITNADNEVTRISTATDKLAEKMLKQDATNKEAAAILIGAFELLRKAQNLRGEYLKKKEEASNKAKAEKIKVNLSVPSIDYSPEETKTVNPEVKKFQELVIDKFGKIKSITSLPQFSKMGSDGKFGPNTRDIVKILKNGFQLPDASGDITKELTDEIQIQTDSIKESDNSRVFKFLDFINISEAAFNLTSAVEFAKTLPTYKVSPTQSKSASSSNKSEVKKEEVKKEEMKKGDSSTKQALTNTQIQTIAEELIEASLGATDEAKVLTAIEKLKNKKDFEILNALLLKANGLQNNRKALKEIGLKLGSQYKNLKDLINGEMGSDDIGTVRLIKDHLNKIGVAASYRYVVKNGEFSEGSFLIK